MVRAPNNMTESVKLLFPTPIHVSHATGTAQFDQIQSDFQSAYDDLIANDVFNNKRWGGNTGLLSDVDFEEDLLTKYKSDAFKSFLGDAVTDYMAQLGFDGVNLSYNYAASWMTLHKTGAFAHTHTHSYSDISGVYYFKTNGQDGSIYFENPVKAQVTGFITHRIDNRLFFTPEVGKLILFPGWLDHGVDFNTTADERVSVSFNINFTR